MGWTALINRICSLTLALLKNNEQKILHCGAVDLCFDREGLIGSAVLGFSIKWKIKYIYDTW